MSQKLTPIAAKIVLLRQDPNGRERMSWHPNYGVIQSQIKVLESLLPAEREAMEHIFIDGWNDCTKKVAINETSYEDGKDYFNKTYTQNTHL